MKQFKFRSGIRIIRIQAYTLDEAKAKLSLIEADAWIDPNWNWTIGVSR